MRKLLLFLLIIAALALVVFKYGGIRELLTLGAVKKVRSADIEEIKKETDDSAKRYRSQLESAEKVSLNYERLGRKYAEQGNWTPAIESFTKALEYGGGSSAEIHYLLGAAYANRAKETDSKDDIAMAESQYGKAVSGNPELSSARYGLGLLVFYLKKERPRGIDIMRELIIRKPDFLDARFALGRFYYENGEPSRALSVYEDLYSALQKRGDSAETQKLLADCKANISRLMSELSRGGRK
jgi:tetratricopeptide (TPR) repeat protein